MNATLGPVWIVLVWIVSAGLGWAIGNSKGKPVDGFVAGLVLGVIGVFIALLMKPAVPKPIALPGLSGWVTDPTSRHQLRYWNGDRWTEHVADAGVQAIDPPVL